MTNECRYINSLYLDCSTFLCQLYSGWKRPFFLSWMTGRELSRRELDFLMLLSDKTLLGLRMTGIYFHTCNSVALASFLTANSFVSLVQMLFSLDEVKTRISHFWVLLSTKTLLRDFLDAKDSEVKLGTILVLKNSLRTQLLFVLLTHSVAIRPKVHWCV